MGEIRIVGPGKTRGYPYPVCKKNSVAGFCQFGVDFSYDTYAKQTRIAYLYVYNFFRDLVSYNR